jgi:hypothetical protein
VTGDTEGEMESKTERGVGSIKINRDEELLNEERLLWEKREELIV